MMMNFGSTLGLEKRARPRRERPVYSSGPLIRREMTPEERAWLDSLPLPIVKKSRRAFTDVTGMTVSGNKIKKKRLGI
ncbi:hypothetical protein [Brevibacillus laterosporus]|uniref:hypothetical protein n=1 Tax=Brevibacillus laterosporus TaxID=1465 RepID=UPI0014445455|nr:hypothetical protein [Brevibacillus laterosporus]NKQ20653.1 hypothetical protein [Brevibacillus laterosporus]WNX29739.1 hypothetical protein RWW94_16065 [Brevibacillus laterosporus]